MAAVPDPLAIADVEVTVQLGDRHSVGIAGYQALFGGDAARDDWQVGNGAVHLRGGEGENRCDFCVADVDAARTLLKRRGLTFSAVDDDPDPAWRFDDVPAAGFRGVRATGTVVESGLSVDHVVFTAPTTQAAIAFFAGQLGLDLRLVKPLGGVAAQVFFRSRSVVVEVIAGAEGCSEISLWGLAWRTADLDAEHARLSAAGLELSEIRSGRKPGTRVSTIREPALGTPTILIEQT